MSNCTMGYDVMMYCPDANCAYHRAVAEVETEKKEKQDPLTQAQATIERQGRAIAKLTEQRDEWINHHLPSAGGKMFAKKKYNAIIEAILNGESNG